jgi:hypothetical protein
VPNRLKAPAIALIVASVLSLLVQVFSLIVPTDLEQMRQDLSQSGMSEEQIEQFMDMIGAMQGGGMVVGFLLPLFVLFGAWKMLQLQGWGLAVAGAIVALVPCQSCCCLTIPFGIWALILLFNAEVKASFQGGPPPMPS